MRVFENNVVRRIFGSKREEVAGGWKRLHNELHNLYASPNIIRVTKLGRIRWSGHIACMEEMKNTFNLVRRPERKSHLVDLGVDRTVILEWTLEKVWTKFIWHMLGTTDRLLSKQE
jgi:hypothetical protein